MMDNSWLSEGSKGGTIISLISGFIMGLATYQSTRNFEKSKKFVEILPVICIFLFLICAIIRYEEMYCPIGLLIFFAMLAIFKLVKSKVGQI